MHLNGENIKMSIKEKILQEMGIWTECSGAIQNHCCHGFWIIFIKKQTVY